MRFYFVLRSNKDIFSIHNDGCCPKKKKSAMAIVFCKCKLNRIMSNFSSFPTAQFDFPPSVSPLSDPLKSDFHLDLTFGTYFMYRARSVARIALSIIFRVALYSSRERPLKIWFPWRERERELELCKLRTCSVFNVKK